MGTRVSLTRWDLDRVLAIAGIIASLVLIVYLWIEIQRAIYILIGILTLISCMIWLTIGRSCDITALHLTSEMIAKLSAVCFFALFTLSIIIIILRIDLYERPIGFFILIAIMAGIIALEAITSCKHHTGFILIQIILLGVIIAWSQLLIFPDIVGIDPWYHSEFTNRMVNEGTIPGGYSYTKMPLFHSMVASTCIITGLTYKFAAMLSVSIGQIICIALFIFLITKLLFNNHRIGLLAALMVIIANHHIFMSIWSIPNGFAVAFIPVILYLFLKRGSDGFNTHNTFFVSAIMILLMAGIILTHSVAAVGMAIVLFVAWGATLIYRTFFSKVGINVSLSIPLGFSIAMLSWWAYASGHLSRLRYLMEWGFAVDIFKGHPSGVENYTITVPLTEQLFNNLGMFLFFTFSFIGIFYMVSRKSTSFTFTMAWVGIVPLAIGFLSLISGRSVIEHRWWYLAQVLLSIPLAVAIYILGSSIFKKPTHIYAFVSSFVIILTFLTILAPSANVDNHLLSPNSAITYAFTESEMKSISAIAFICESEIGSEGYVRNAVSFMDIDINLNNIDNNIYLSNYSDSHLDALMMRNEMKFNTFSLFGSSYKLNYDLESILYNHGYYKTYCSNSICLYNR